MRPVFSTESEFEFQEIANRLTDAGIPIVPAPRHAELPGYTVGARIMTIQIWLDHQYDDALQLIRNPLHVVQSPVAGEQFLEMQQQVREEQTQAQDRWNERLLNGLVGLLLIAVIGFVAYRALS